MAGRRANRLVSVLVAAGLAALALRSCLSAFVGGPSEAARRSALVARPVGVDYLLRNGPKDADPPLADPTAASGAVHEVTYKKRPFGIKRYAPGKDGTGAVVMTTTEKSRYP